MNEYHIMFRNGDGVTIKGDALCYDENFITIWNKTDKIAMFSWSAVIGFIREEKE